ncbi:hypothetical protein [Salinibacter ruber]|uniref:Uncharacterized protein n=1 Tax=Salinibacter ruber TaxID=146919 RepID=A0AAW5P619_9BACT|nr:hypothetical protein [Salinibacter ruber]MCS4156919.1 hypothetical protein [Salinibacter ruber]
MEVLEIVGGKEGVVTIRDACGEVLTTPSDAKAPPLSGSPIVSTEDESYSFDFSISLSVKTF